MSDHANKYREDKADQCKPNQKNLTPPSYSARLFAPSGKASGVDLGGPLCVILMSKRFCDTEKYKKSFIRSLKAPYKLLWDYICLDCNHAGIWHKDFEIAQIFIGLDAPVDEKEALRVFNTDEERIQVIGNGNKWFIRPFVDFQYGPLNPNDRVHFSVVKILQKEGIKPLTSPLQGAMVKVKVKDKVKDSEFFNDFWELYPKKKAKGRALRAWNSLNPDKALLEAMLLSLRGAKNSPDWLKEDGKYIPHPATWLNDRRWEDVGVKSVSTDNYAKFEVD